MASRNAQNPHGQVHGGVRAADDPHERLAESEEFRRHEAAKEKLSSLDQVNVLDLSFDDGELEDYYLNGRLVTSLASPDDAGD
ncbi:MAG: hypothetical protein H0S85_07930 [Desulfovibrionaceae bacterium]|jgi:hypothetical protein|nr:hypothetical protein [Desulfovibrionaceae bacterium]